MFFSGPDATSTVRRCSSESIIRLCKMLGRHPKRRPSPGKKRRKIVSVLHAKAQQNHGVSSMKCRITKIRLRDPWHRTHEREAFRRATGGVIGRAEPFCQNG